MPHVVISCFKAAIPAPSLERLASEIARLLEQELACSPTAVSVDLELVEPDRWKDEVYLPRIVPRLEELIRRPQYSY